MQTPEQRTLDFVRYKLHRARGHGFALNELLKSTPQAASRRVSRGLHDLLAELPDLERLAPVLQGQARCWSIEEFFAVAASAVRSYPQAVLSHGGDSAITFSAVDALPHRLIRCLVENTVRHTSPAMIHLHSWRDEEDVVIDYWDEGEAPGGWELPEFALCHAGIRHVLDLCAASYGDGWRPPERRIHVSHGSAQWRFRVSVTR